MSMGVAEFCRFCTLSRFTATEFLDLDNCYDEQNEERRRRFEEKLSFQIPVLKTDYESAWPIDAYMTQYLRRRMYAARMYEKKDRPIRKMGPRRDFEIGRVKNKKSASNHTSAYLTRRAGLEERMAVMSNLARPSTAQPYVLLPSLSSVIRRTSGKFRAEEIASTNISTAEGISGPSSSRMVQTENGSSGVIRAFLRTLKPNLESFLADFMEVGIITASDFKALLSWPTEDRDRFFAKEFGQKMSCFQLGALQMGCIRHSQEA